MEFGKLALDKERDIIVELDMEEDGLHYVLRTPNHKTGNLITNLAKLCDLPLSVDEQGLRVIRGIIPCYIDGYNHEVYVLRMGNTKIANIYPDGQIEMKASIPAISKTLMSQTTDYRMGVQQTIVKTYIQKECKFHTDLHTHMNGNLPPDVLIALGIIHQIRYPLYYVRKLALKCTERQEAELEKQRAQVKKQFTDSPLTGRYLERRINDHTFINFADLILNNPADAVENIAKIRNSLTIPKDGQAVFADLEKVYLYRYIFTKGVRSDFPIALPDLHVPDPEVQMYLEKMLEDGRQACYQGLSLFQHKLLYIARMYASKGIRYVEISDTTLVKPEASFKMLSEVHAVMPVILEETGVLIRFLAAIRRTPLTIVKDQVTPNDYLAENLRVLYGVLPDPYVAGADIVGEEINDIMELQPIISALVRIAAEEPTFVLRIHAGENDSLRDNVANSLACVTASLSEGQRMPRVRIGHGLYTSNLRSLKGRKLLHDLKSMNVVLEFQITSNVRLNNLSDMRHHPLKTYLQEGISCVQGTDGGALYGTDSIDEELALQKLLGLSQEELMKIATVDNRLAEEGFAAFSDKKARFASMLAGKPAETVLQERVASFEKGDSLLWLTRDRVDAYAILSGSILPFPGGKVPVLVAGGSFNSEHHRTVLRAEGKMLIRELLEKADPEKVFFVIGNTLRGYERFLVEENRGRFQIFAIVPSLIDRQEAEKLIARKIPVRVAIEPSPMGLYKSFAYEAFKRMPSILLALDGNSAAANLIQEAKNGRFPCRTYVDRHSRVLMTKARALHGYVTVIEDGMAAAEDIFRRFDICRKP